jgi:hypothetical protein
MTATQLKAVPAAYEIEVSTPPGPPGDSRLTAAILALITAPIGANFFVPGDGPKTAAIYQSAWRRGGKGWVILRKADGGTRVWKIAEPKRFA